MDEIVKHAQTGISADQAQKLMKGIAESRNTTPAGSGGKPFLRLLKDGNWVYGQENVEVQEGSHWAVNPMTLSHGWVCWFNPPEGSGQKNEMRGDVMVPMTHDKPEQPAPKGGAPFVSQLGCEMRCMSGEDSGVEVLYKTNSDGGLKAMDGLRLAIQLHLAEPRGLAFPCPVLDLKMTHYPHPNYGRTYKPIFEIAGWCDMLGNMDKGEPIAAVLPEPTAPPPEEPVAPVRTRARRPAVAKATEAAPPPPKAAEKPVEPVAAPQAHTGQRRRPVAR
jgi:hypothetical protein